MLNRKIFNILIGFSFSKCKVFWLILTYSVYNISRPEISIFGLQPINLIDFLVSIPLTWPILCLVMFGNCWKPSASSISGRVLHFIYLYAVLFGVISFGIKRNNDADCILVAYKRNWFKWFCLLTRLIWSSLYCYSYGVWATLNSYGWMKMMFGMRLLGCLICTICILVLQYWYDKKIINLVNSFFKLFRRISALSDQERSVYGNTQEMVLLGFKIISLAYIICLIQLSTSPWAILTILCDIYTSVGTSMIMHACFVGYLSIGVLYTEINHYVYHDLRSMQQSNREPSSLYSLKVIRIRLKECLDIYDEIQSICRKFQQLFEIPLFLTLVQSLSTMAMISYNVIVQDQFENFNLWGLLIKMLIDVVLLTLAVYSAVSSFQVIRRLSLETYFVNQSKMQHKEMEMFLGRLHFNNLRVRPLGLFEVSNELTLFFLSAMITYLAFLLQYGRELQQI